MPTYLGTEGTYELLDRLGAGGNGEVWRAQWDHGVVAIKLLKKGRAPADAATRFVREIAALRRLTGVVGVLPLLDADPDPARSLQPWFAMPVASILRERLGPEAGLQDICAAMAEIASALARVHEQGVVHRDIKPDNLYWHDGHWCLGDFGLADFQGADSLTRSDRKLGPAYYIAPEMLNSPSTADGRPADVYSVGKTLWVLASGQNYPLPGVHDPTFRLATLTSYRDDPRTTSLDELLQRMSLLDPARRPSASLISRELAILGKATTMDTPPDPTSSLRRLREALVPHLSRESEEERQRAVAKSFLSRLQGGLDELVNAIQDQSGLSAEVWSGNGVVKYWGVGKSLGEPSVVWEECTGYSFVAGGSRISWRLSLGAKCQLLSDGNLNIHVGYQFERLFHGRDASQPGGPQGWEGEGRELNGAPACEDLANRLVAGLKANLPAMADRFAELVRQAAAG